MDRNLALEGVRITEAAALASARLMGRGDRIAADQAATEAMRGALNDLDVEGEVVIGEGERDEAPVLYVGERVGRAGAGALVVELALDPLEGTKLCATGAANAIWNTCASPISLPARCTTKRKTKPKACA